MNFNPERRKLLKHGRDVAAGLGLGYLATRIPRVYGQPLTIPKLSYSPTIDQLLSDYSVQQEMLSVDLQATATTPVYGKGALGVDDNHTNFIMAKTSQTTSPVGDLHVSIAIDRDHSGGGSPDADDFAVICDLQQKSELLRQGGNGIWGNPQPIDFPWNALQKESYFSPNQANYIFGVQVPNSYMGPGGAGGLYGLFLGIIENYEGVFPSYPAIADGRIPNTWASFSTAIPVPEFQLPQLLIPMVIAFPVVLAKWKQRRAHSVEASPR